MTPSTQSSIRSAMGSQSQINDRWTEDLVNALKALWHDGLSASQIAAELGQGFTRNSVIAKVHRLKLSKRGTVRRTKAQKSAAGQAFVAASRRANGKGDPKAPAIMAKKLRNSAPAFETAPLPEEELGNDVTPLIGSVLGLTEHTCKWPIGDPFLPGFGFCGRHSIDGSPYCEDHHKRGTRQP